MKRLATDIAALFVSPPGERAAAPPRPQPPSEPPGIDWQPPVAAPPRATDAPPPAVKGESPGRRRRRAAPVSVPVAPPVAAAVVGTGPDAVVLGSALASELRARHGAMTALLLVWHPGDRAPAAMPAWPAARALADGLADGDAVFPRGRLVELRLPQDPQAASLAAARLTRESRVPTVLALAGPRSSEFDRLLVGRDVVVVVDHGDAPASLAGLVVSDLTRLNRRVVVAEPVGGAGRRRLALAGLSRARDLGRRIEALRP